MFRKRKLKIEAIFLKPIGEKNFDVYKTLKIKTDEKQEKKIQEENSKVYEEIGKKDIKPIDDIVSFENKTFPLPKGVFTFKDKKSIKIFYDYENEKILCFKQHSCLISAEWLDNLINKKLIAQLVATIRKGMDTATGNKTILQFVFVGAVCLIIGALLGKGYF